ncbi:uncharacterized protein N7477_009308, partial [Penicillium maclennaniae]|uniref:uncharacterized protein n=1 Tax=Penicillium maclennaniae TaxID=1343394 RepID=UPI0025424D30
ILDNAFLLNIRSVEDIFKTYISLLYRSLKLDFKKDKLNRLSLAIGIIRAIKPYNLRRGIGEAVDTTKVALLTLEPYLIIIICLRQIRDTLAIEARELYRSIKKVASIKIGELKVKVDTTLRVAKKKLKEAIFAGARNEFFATINIIEINKQLNLSLLDIKYKIHEPERVIHCL